VTDILDDFIFDSREQLENASAHLMELEKNPRSLSDLNALMGSLHTIKGNSGFVNLRHLYELLHNAETLLQTVREKPESPLMPKIIECLFQVLDTVEAIMGRLENGEDDEADWMGALSENLAALTASVEQTPEGGEAAEPEAPAPEAQPAQAPASARTVLAQPIRPAPLGELKAAAPKKAKKAPQPPAPEAAAAPPEKPAAPAAPDAPDPAAAFESDGPVSVLELTDGLLHTQGQGLYDRAEELRRGGAKGLILDMRGLGAVYSDELKLIDKFYRSWGPGLGLVLSEEDNPDLFRIFDVLKKLEVYKFYPEDASARDALGR
jgi:chemotaxis protein histidine kinase CheA